MLAVLDRGTSLGHYLLGGSEETLAALKRVIARRFPTARIVGAESPAFRALSDAEVAAQDSRIRQSGAQVVWVGLGTPKQDWEVARLSEELPVVALAVGAAFDFLAGTKSQAPMLMQSTGTEWLYRLASEPRRLAKRYLWGNPRFLRAAVRNPGLRKK
jgi:N-acetylglucosaminyldiphosphoundecaprenol N-acetyl-beta-D-mannosaminyltransferase